MKMKTSQNSKKTIRVGGTKNINLIYYKSRFSRLFLKLKKFDFREIVYYLDFIYHIKLIPVRLVTAWHRLWIRRNEFHSSLNIDVITMLNMDKIDRDRYLNNVTMRRQFAHLRDLS